MNKHQILIDKLLLAVDRLKVLSSKSPEAVYHRKCAGREIQYYFDMLPNIISKAALDFCNENKIDWTKLPNYNYRKVVGGQLNKPNLIAEHATPKSVLLSMLIEADVSEWDNLIEEHSVVCWITREENNRLEKSGYRQKRPGGWKKCYELCGIVLPE